MNLGVGHWENRSVIVRSMHPNPAAVGGFCNLVYAVTHFQHSRYPGVDHLCVQRHDGGIQVPWSDLQRIKDELAPGGPQRCAIEVYPPLHNVVDNCNLRHIWVMPAGWTPPVDLREVRV